MKSLVYLGPRNMEIREEEIPDNDIVIKVHASGICGTDLKTYLKGHHSFIPPVVLGHECYGEIVKSPDECSYKKGDKVVVAPYAECGECDMCKKGFGELCSNKFYMKSGCFSEYIGMDLALADRLLFRASDIDKAYSLVEPLACVLTGIEKLCFDYNNALIVGGGPMGAMFAATLKLRGKQVKVAEISNYRVDYLKKINIDAVNPDQLKDEKYDLIVIAVNRIDLIDIYSEYVAAAGELVLFSGLPKGEKGVFNPFHVHYREVRISGTSGYNIDCFRQAYEMLNSNKTFFEKLISHSFAMDEAMAAFSLLEKGEAMKAILRMV